MKSNIYKVSLLFVLSFMFCIIANGQTYFYKYLYSVDETGVRHENHSPDRYFTITNNRQIIYQCDKNGINHWGEAAIYRYQGEKNGFYIYMLKSSVGTKYLYVSKDFSRINRTDAFFTKLIDVLELANPNEIEAPERLY